MCQLLVKFIYNLDCIKKYSISDSTENILDILHALFCYQKELESRPKNKEKKIQKY